MHSSDSETICLAGDWRIFKEQISCAVFLRMCRSGDENFREFLCENLGIHIKHLYVYVITDQSTNAN